MVDDFSLRGVFMFINMIPMMTTRPAPAPTELDQFPCVPPSARLTALAMAALENGVSSDDVLAYLSARNSVPRAGHPLPAGRFATRGTE